LPGSGLEIAHTELATQPLARPPRARAHRETRAVREDGQCVVSDGAALGKEKLAAPYIETNFSLGITKTQDLFAPWTLWDTVMIAVVIGSTILFCFWARIRATGGDR
jgi:hypothetical protein